MIHTAYDQAMQRHVAIGRVAERLRITDWDLETATELLPQIEKKDPRAYQILTHFLTAADDWFKFHEEIARADKTGKLSPAESKELRRLVEVKQRARNNLIQLVESMA
jgi:hypothetical protein